MGLTVLDLKAMFGASQKFRQGDYYYYYYYYYYFKSNEFLVWY